MARAASPPAYAYTINAQDPSTWGGAASAFDAVQNAVDAGGKILLRGTFQFGFNCVVVGRNGNGVEIYGERDHATKIIGGAPAFVNSDPGPDGTQFPVPTAVDSNVSIRIENLDLAPSGVFGIFFERCSSATVENCIIRMNPPLFWGMFKWSAAVFFRFVSPNSGPIRVADNMIYCDGPNNGGAILYGNFGGIRPLYTATNNIIEASGPLASSGFLFHGESANIEISYNTIRGPGTLPAIVNSCIDFFENWDSSGNRIFGNNLRQTVAQKQYSALDSFGYWMPSTQIRAGHGVIASDLMNNDFGSATENAGAIIAGSGNTITNENFWGNYPGKLANPSLPCVIFGLAYVYSGYYDESQKLEMETNGYVEPDYKWVLDLWGGWNLYELQPTTDNTLMALKNGQSLQGITKCTQILDMHYERTGELLNNIRGFESCKRMPLQNLNSFEARIQSQLAKLQRKDTKGLPI